VLDMFPKRARDDGEDGPDPKRDEPPKNLRRNIPHLCYHVALLKALFSTDGGSGEKSKHVVDPLPSAPASSSSSSSSSSASNLAKASAADSQRRDVVAREDSTHHLGNFKSAMYPVASLKNQETIIRKIDCMSSALNEVLEGEARKRAKSDLVTAVKSA
ncbi:hypothetical protein FOZ61_003893, partial [Perkinsus olseni]